MDSNKWKTLFFVFTLTHKPPDWGRSGDSANPGSCWPFIHLHPVSTLSRLWETQGHRWQAGLHFQRLAFHTIRSETAQCGSHPNHLLFILYCISIYISTLIFLIRGGLIILTLKSISETTHKKLRRAMVEVKLVISQSKVQNTQTIKKCIHLAILI